MRVAYLLYAFLSLSIVFADTIEVKPGVKTEISEDSNDESVFIPTHEWQPVKEGQPVPKGLHVRINLETRQIEAKLISDEHDNKRTDVLSLHKDDSSQGDAVASLKEKNIKESLINLERSGKDSEELVNTIENKFRSYKELKEAFKKYNMDVKTDLEIMDELVKKFKILHGNKGEKWNDEKLAILTDLEYLVHQFDNALEFIKLGGVSDIVLPMLNSSEPKLRAEAAHLIGSAAQSNVKVQIAGLENGVISSLLKTIWLDSDVTVQARSFYAISCLIRNFPAAQAQFVKDGGLSILAQVFEREKENHKLKVKIITLLNDLLSERQNLVLLLTEAMSNKTEIHMKMDQYRAVGLEETFVEHGWCSRTAEMILTQDQNWNRAKKRDDLTSALSDLPIPQEHDFVEKVLDALLVMFDVCHLEYKSNLKLQKMILVLKEWYSDLSMKENLHIRAKYGDIAEPDENYSYYSGIADLLEKLNEKLKKLDVKDEL